MENKILFLNVLGKSMEAEKMPAVVSKRRVDEFIPKEDFGHTNPNIYRNLTELQELIA